MKETLIFVKGQRYGNPHVWPLTLAGLQTMRFPAGAYIRVGNPRWSNSTWYRSDLTPVLDQDVPQELLALCLVLDALE